MLFGAHVSIAGGLQEAPRNAAALGCEVFQMFTRSPRGGPAPAITPETVKGFRDACDEHGQAAWYIHAPYYINFASGKKTTRAASARVIREELERGSMIGATAVMTHLGSAKDFGEKEALQAVIEAVHKVLDGYKGTTRFLLEIAAGSGRVIGSTFEDLATILKAVDHRCGICFDTQHAFASGYDLRTKADVEKTFDSFDRVIGLEHLVVSHCNDSMVELGSHKDRHEHIGKGCIGEEGFRAIVREPRLKKMDLLLETKHDAVIEDLKILKKLRGKAS